MPHPTASRSRPLEGMRIVELSSYVASPLGGMTLAQLGADVIRVEPLNGAPDRTRHPLADSGTSLYWSGLNKGKRAVEVDLRSEEGRELVAGLATGGGPGGGIVIANSERHQDLSYDALAARRPDLIHVLLTGRRDGSAAVDYTVQAATGFPQLTGPEATPDPVNHLMPAWDVAAGLYLAVGLLAAERHRLRTGEGQQVRVALEDVALATAGNLGYLAEAQLGAAPRERAGNYVYGTFGRDFATSDGGRLMVVALTDRHWRGLLEVTGMTDAIGAVGRALGADLSDEFERYTHRKVLGELLAGWFAAHTLAEAQETLARTRVLWSTYRSFADLAADDARLLRENPLMARVGQSGVPAHWAPGSPVVMDDTQSLPEPSPRVGQHTDDVFRTELGLGEAELEKLGEAGVIRRRRAAHPFTTTTGS